MSPISSIPLSPLTPGDQGQITQLYRYLELFSEGTPPRHTLYVYAPAAGPVSVGAAAAGEDQLLIIDPPADLSQRFRLGNQVAALYTGTPQPTSVPLVQTQPGGVAHLRIGNHFLDVYSQQVSNIVHLPALGVICGGGFASDSRVPRLATGSDGSDELETLRLLVGLVKQHRLALYIPYMGSKVTDKLVVIERLAEDVGYLNALRRLVTPLAARGEGLEAVIELAEAALPRSHRSPLDITTHQHNVTTLIQAMSRP